MTTKELLSLDMTERRIYLGFNYPGWKPSAITKGVCVNIIYIFTRAIG